RRRRKRDRGSRGDDMRPFVIVSRVVWAAAVAATLHPAVARAQNPSVAAPPGGSSQAQPAPSWKAPRTSDGQPDLQGLWTNLSLTPLERPASQSGKDVLSATEV